jgi:hypothetical protein
MEDERYCCCHGNQSHIMVTFSDVFLSNEIEQAPVHVMRETGLYWGRDECCRLRPRPDALIRVYGIPMQAESHFCEQNWVLFSEQEKKQK